MNIGEAVAAMRAGQKVAREGWNGKGMFIVLIGVDTPLDSQPYLALHTAQGKWQPGWNASTPDLLASDWVVVS